MDPLQLIKLIMALRDRKGPLSALPSGRSGTFSQPHPLKTVGDVRTNSGNLNRLWSRDFNPPRLIQSPGIDPLQGGVTPMHDQPAGGGSPGDPMSVPLGVPLADPTPIVGTPLQDTSQMSLSAPPEGVTNPPMDMPGMEQGLRGDQMPGGGLRIGPDTPSEADMLAQSRESQDMILNALMKQRQIQMQGAYPPVGGM